MSYDSIIAASGPIAYWKCEELTPPGPAPNSDFIDSSGNSHSGTLQPNAVAGLIQGITGPILTDSPSYGARGGLARIPSLGPNTGAILLTGAQTWECWFQLSGSGVHMLMNRGADATNTYLAVGQRSTGLFVTSVIASLDWAGELRGLSSCALNADQWYYAALTYDGVDTMELYVDGWLVDSDNTCPPAPLTDTNPWRMGYGTNVIFGAVFRSYALSHIAIYDYVLTQAELRTHVVAALGELPDNPCGPSIELGCPNGTGVVGEPYSSELTVIDGVPPYTFSIISGVLPDGLTLNTITGAITGTPTVGGVFNFVAQVVDDDSNTAETPAPGCQIVINEIPPVPPSPPPVQTMEFDAFGPGSGSAYWFIPQLSDSGNELRSKEMKAIHLTGRVHNCRAIGYAFDPEQPINLLAMERGERIYPRNNTRPQAFPDTSHVEQTRRKPISINGTLHTCRVSGNDIGQEERDRIDEAVMEISDQGVRR